MAAGCSCNKVPSMQIVPPVGGSTVLIIDTVVDLLSAVWSQQTEYLSFFDAQ